MTNLRRHAARPAGTAPAGGRAVTWAGIRGVIMDRITHGIYPPGSLIPTEQQFAAEFGSARATVNRALTSLAERGVLERRRRVGTRVVLGLDPASQRAKLPVIRDMVEGRGHKFNLHFLGRVDRPVPTPIRERLFQSNAADLQEYCALLCADDTLICAERRWTDMLSLPGLTDEVLTTTSANEWIALNVTITLIERTVSAHRAAEVEADGLLDCPPDAPVLVNETVLWIGSRPVSLARHSFVPGFQFDPTLS